jgi:small subunit ribosomal protein S20
MAITSSAKKALRGSKKKTVFNMRRKNDMKDITKKVKKLVGEMKVEEAVALMAEAYQIIDKAVKTNFIKKNAGSRKKSRLMAMIKRAKGAK